MSTKIEFEEDITKLIPINKGNENASKVFKSMKFADKIIVNIALENEGNVNDLTAFADAFLDSLNATSSQYVDNIQGKIDDEATVNTLDFVYNNLPLFLNAEDYKTIENKLRQDSLAAITKNNYKTLVSPSGIVLKKTIVKDPLGLSFLGLKKLQSLSLGNDFNLSNGYLLTADKKHILLFISPKLKSSETAQNAKLSENLYAIANTLNSSFKSKVSVDYFGGALVAVENAKQIKHDIQFTVSITLTILLVILIIFYRKLLLPIILFVPTIFGGLLAITVLFLFREKISAISLGIGSVLLGVTLDYALHILTHIRDNNNIKSLYKEITKPVLMSSVTTSLAFFCLLFLDSQALQDLGLFAGVSALGASVFALLLIPHLYKKSQSKKYSNTVIDAFASINFHKNKFAFIVIALAIMVSLFTYNKVGFNKDLSKLNFEPPKLMKAQSNLEQITNVASKSVYVAAHGNTLEEALRVNDSVFNLLNGLKKNKEIIDFSSVAALVQSKKNQNEKIKQWQQFWNENDKDSVKLNLIESGKTLGFKPETHQKFYNLINEDFQAIQPSKFSELNVLNVDDFISESENFYTVSSLVKLDETNVEAFSNQFKTIENVVVIDRKGINEQFLGNLKTDFNHLVLYSLIVVVIILLLAYKSFSLTFITVVPIALTWFVTIGLMGLLGIKFNIFNIIISSFIFGLGIDYGIFITNGLLHEYRTGEPVLNTHKTSIILSVITTILGVGVLIFAKHPALYTISVVSLIGILSAMIMAFTIQPLLFKLLIGSKTSRPKTVFELLHSTMSFTYYGLGTILLSFVATIIIKLRPGKREAYMLGFHKFTSRFLTSVLKSNPFVPKRIINNVGEDFEKPAVIIANHTSFLDTLTIEMVSSKIIFLVNDWVYNSPVYARAMKLAGYFPVSDGIDNGLEQLKEKVAQGYSIMVFPEGSRSFTNKINRFHKGAFYLAEQFNLDVLPIMIHGNSEVNSKGDFIIRKGKITIKVLERIKANNISFGETTRARTKLISQHFKTEFFKFRKESEDATYFHHLVLCDFRYKGDALYKWVKTDLKIYKNQYYKILQQLHESKQVSHISDKNGQLDFLMALNNASLKIESFIEDVSVRKILENSYLSNTHYKINYSGTFDAFKEKLSTSEVLIIDSEIDIHQLKSLENIKTLVLLKESCTLSQMLIKTHGFNLFLQEKELVILKK
ncbi:MMPL family transporter [Neotamlana sedimentorum]|uniref:MMPL family transporter n=1 Tax=Neotamlana sedimentorum TaxID=1435349 RepID=UPI001F0AA81A|nr:MMPL family transporter [Tamlana sedimentorum]